MAKTKTELKQDCIESMLNKIHISKEPINIEAMMQEHGLTLNEANRAFDAAFGGGKPLLDEILSNKP